MAFFAVNYTYDPAKDVEAVRPRHREFLRGLAERGVLRASGPFPGLEPQRALLIFEADSAEEVPPCWTRTRCTPRTSSRCARSSSGTR